MNLQVLSSKPQFLAHGLNELVANLDIYFPALMKLKCKLMFHHQFQFLEIMKLSLSSIANTDKYTSAWKKKNYIYLSWGTNELSDPDIANKVTNI